MAITSPEVVARRNHAAVEAVLDLHHPMVETHPVDSTSYFGCSECIYSGDTEQGINESAVPYPCPTVRAIENALRGD